MKKILKKTCLVCEKYFLKPQNESFDNWNNRHKYCSRECANLAPRSKETRLKQRLAKLGKPSWNKGKKLTEAHKVALRKKHRPLSEYTKRKMSENRMGKKLPLEWRKNISSGQIGEKGNNWQGGITPINNSIRKSFEYREWRKAVFIRDNYTCQECSRKRKKGDRVIIQAHHKKSFSLYPKLRFIVSNGKTLCKECHMETKSYGKNIVK